MLYATLALTLAVLRHDLNLFGVVAERESDNLTQNGLFGEGGRRHRLLTHRQNLIREELTTGDEEQQRHLKKDNYGVLANELSLAELTKNKKKEILSRLDPKEYDLTKHEKKRNDGDVDNGDAGNELVDMSKKDKKVRLKDDKSNRNKNTDDSNAGLTKKEKKEIIKKNKTRNKDADLTKKEKKELRKKKKLRNKDSALTKKEKKELMKRERAYGTKKDEKTDTKNKKDGQEKKNDNGKKSDFASSFASGGGSKENIEKEDDQECICEEITWGSGGSRALKEAEEDGDDDWSMADGFGNVLQHGYENDDVYDHDEDNDNDLVDDSVFRVDGLVDNGRLDTMDELMLMHSPKSGMQTFTHGLLEYTSWGGSSSKSGKSISHTSKSGKGGKSTKRAKIPKRGKGKKNSGKSKKVRPPVHCTCEPTRRPTPRPTPKKAPPVPESPTFSPTLSPSLSPTFAPTLSPTMSPTITPTSSPTFSPTLHPTESPTLHPTVSPTFSPTWSPTLNPTLSPTPIPTVPPGAPSRPPTTTPTSGPTPQPSPPPTPAPGTPTSPPTIFPTQGPTSASTNSPTEKPSLSPFPTQPTIEPTKNPTPIPGSPTRAPTKLPTLVPGAPTRAPTPFPTALPTRFPTKNPTPEPGAPTRSPTRTPTPQPGSPTNSPTRKPTAQPTISPTKSPTRPPTVFPTRFPTRAPTPAPGSPTRAPTRSPTRNPTRRPSNEPTVSPTESPSSQPTFEQDVIDLGACSESNYAPVYQETLQVLNANDNSLFGSSVSMDGSWAVVGSPGAENQFGDATGTAYLYRFGNGRWRQRQEFSPSSRFWEFSEFGRSVSLSGNTLVIGAPERNSGTVVVYTRQQESDAFDDGIELSRPSSLSDDARFGYSVSIDGNLLIVGAPNNSNGRGSSFIYNYNDVTETWDLENMLESNSSQNLEGGNFGWSVSIGSDLIVVGAPFDEADNVRSGTASIYRRDINNGVISWSLIQQLLPESNSRSNGDEFGWDTAIDVVNNIATVSVSARGMVERSGAVYVFTSESSTFDLQQKLVAFDPQANANFGESVSLSGDDIIVGSPLFNNGVGAAYYYRRIDSSWTLGGKEFIPLGQDGDTDLYGLSVALSDGNIFIGSPAAETSAFNGGQVDAFFIGCLPSCPPGAVPGFGLRPQNTEVIASPDQDESEMFGYSVSVFGSYAIVGAPGGENDGGIATGAAYVLAFTGGRWREHQKLIPFDVSADDMFGYAVSISSDVIVVGSPNQDDGAAYIFRKNVNDNFQLEEKLIESSSTSNAYFGAAVDVDGSYIIVGSRKNRNGRGSASIYSYDQGNWDFDTLLQPNSSDGVAYDGNFGWSVSISDNIAAVGAPNDLTVGSIRSGKVYIYERSVSSWNIIQIIGDSDTVESRNPGDSFGVDVDINKFPSFNVETTLVVGANGKDIDLNGINLSNAGAAYVFVKANSGLFSLQQTLLATDPSQDEAFGSSVAVDLDSFVVGKVFGDAYYYHRQQDGTFEEGQRFTSSLDVDVNNVAIYRDRIFAGAQNTVNNNVESGAVLIFAIECDELCAPSDLSAVMNQKISPPNQSSDNRFGTSIAFDTNTNIAVIGAAYARNSDDIATGVVYLFGFVDFQWKIITELTLANGFNGDLFGYSVAVTGSTVVVGAPGRQSGKGTAHVFKPNSSGDFSQTQTIQPSGIANNAFFGSAVDADGNLLVIGARLDRNGRGSVFTYSRETAIVDYEWEITFAPTDVSVDVDEGNFGWSVAIHLNSVIIGAPNDIISTLQSGSAFIYRRAEEVTGDFVWNEVEKIEHPIAERANGNMFGFSVDIFVDCETLTTSVLIGVPLLDGEPSNILADAGAAYLFSEFVTGSFTLVNKFLPAEQNEGAQFGSSVTLDEGVAVVGSPFYNSNVGAAYLFGRSTDGWAVGSMIVARPTSSDLFGSYVVLEGSQVLISAPANSENGMESGKVYSYEVGCSPVCARLKSAPLFIQAFLPTDANSNDEFGYSVQVYGSYAVLGSPGFDNNGDNRGRVSIFRFVNGVWVLVENIFGQSDGDRFGYSVSISGSIFAVGSPFANDSRGAVSVLELSGNSVLERVTLRGDSQGDFFGASVDVSEANIVVGAPLARTGAGSVYVYSETSSNTWNLDQSIAPSDVTEDGNGGNFGFSVAIFFDTIIVGAKSQDVATGQSGASYIYKRVSEGNWDRIERIAPIDGSTGDQFGYSVDVYNNFDTEMTYAIVGARRASGTSGVPLSGQVYVYTSFRSGSFTLQQILVATELDQSRGFGTSVSIDDKHVVVGAAIENSIGTSYFYQLIEDKTWSGTEILSPSKDKSEGFGSSVSLYQDHIFIGGPQKDSDRGSAYYYDIRLVCDTNPTEPTPAPTNAPTPQQTVIPTRAPTRNPTREPNEFPTRNPTRNPTKDPTRNPTRNPTTSPSRRPTGEPTNGPTRNPTRNPTRTPTSNPMIEPTRKPSDGPTRQPTKSPIRETTRNPTKTPTLPPTKAPTRSPTRTPTKSPNSPTESPTEEPTSNPTEFPSAEPTRNPTPKPTLKPTNQPTDSPSKNPSQYPSDSPTKAPITPTKAPTNKPTRKPTPAPTRKPTKSPTTSPTTSPTINPTLGLPTISPTQCDIFVPKTEYRRRVEAVDRDTDFEFGYAVAIWNVTAVVGSPGSISVPTLFPGAGYSYDFKFDNELQRFSWKYTGKLAPQPGIGDGIGISVSVAGNYAILGGPFDDQLGTNSGSVHLFQRTSGGDAFTFAQTIYSPTPAASALFGWSVAVNENGDVAIGARGDRVARGSVYIYSKSPDSPLWTFVDTLEPDVTQDLQNVGNFGWSVAFGDNILVVGAPNEGLGAEKYGAVLVYERAAGNTWTLAETLIPMDGRQGDLFGFSVAIDEPTIVVGSRNATHNGLADAGAVYVYDYSSSGIDLTQKLIAENRAARALFGQSVAISGGRLVVGAPYPSNIGSVYLYYQDDGSWELSERIVAEDTGIGTNVGIEFGASVAVTVDHLVIGSPANDVAAKNSGSVFFYDIFEEEQCRK